VDGAPASFAGPIAEGPARLLGRALRIEAGRLWLADATGGAEVRGEGPEAEAGAWVDARGRWDGARLVEARWTVVQRPRRPFPTPDGDWAFLTAAGRSRHLRRRAQLRAAVRAFLEAEGCLEVETPQAVPNPGMDLHLDAPRLEGEDRWLHTSPEYAMKRLLAAGLPRLYQLARCHRRGEAGRLHAPEFTMLEWYVAGADAAAMRAMTERLVAEVAATVGGAPRATFDGRAVDLTPPWPVLRVEEAFRELAGGPPPEDDAAFFLGLVDRIEPALAARPRPTWLVAWPARHASLARLDEDGFAERFEAYVGGVELCNGFAELTDPVEQRRRFEADRDARRAEGKPVYPMDERLLAALEEGLPPCAGNALGFDRLCLLLSEGAEALEDVVAIPSERG
jgi:lysyl-tRNA synthetase class 2